MLQGNFKLLKLLRRIKQQGLQQVIVNLLGWQCHIVICGLLQRRGVWVVRGQAGLNGQQRRQLKHSIGIGL